MSALRVTEADCYLSDKEVGALQDENLTFGAAFETLLNWCVPARNAGPWIDQVLLSSTKSRDKKFAEKKGLNLLQPRIEVEFQRPRGTSEIRVVGSWIYRPRDAAPSVHPSIQVKLVYGTPVSTARIKQPDRTDITVITDRTLRAVAESLNT